jgi:hypothetical protein
MGEEWTTLRKSKLKQDAENALDKIQNKTGLNPWSREQAGSLLEVAYITGELPLETNSRTKRVSADDLVEWYENQVLRLTVELSQEDYERASAYSFYDILVGELDQTDFGSGGRQRSLGQHLEDALGGYLAEFAVAKFLENKGLEIVNLDLGRNAEVEEMKGSDIVSISSNGDLKPPELDIQIKKSKPGSMWLPLNTKDENDADVYILARVGLPNEHLVMYLQTLDVFEEIIESLDDERQNKLIKEIPPFNNIPVHISGFANWSEFKNGGLNLDERQKYTVITGGIGKVPSAPPAEHDTSDIKLEQGSLNENYIAATSALNADSEDWLKLIERL